MNLVIVESPAKSKTISKYLGPDYTVKASIGHVRDLPKSNKNAIDIAGGFIPRYEIVPTKKRVVAELKDLARKADSVILATDPDREGEAIAWHIIKAIGLDNVKSKTPNVKRIVFHEITEDAIKEALKHPRGIDEDLRKAQEARRVLDRLVGYGLSGLIWKKLRYGLSAGRVQSPALRILVEREREIQAFKPEDFWVITAEVKTKKGEEFSLTCSKEPRDKQEVDHILSAGRAGIWVVEDVAETETRRLARAPFTTSTLQQAASSRLGFTPSRTMSIAQRLYEAGHITYMRTDSTILSSAAQKQIIDVVAKKYGRNYAKPHQYKTKSKSAQEAHEAIRPTKAGVEDAGGTDEQRRLYRLIWQRAIASQMAPARLLKTKITVRVDQQTDNNKLIPSFLAHGSRTLFDGWLKADPQARSDDTELPQVSTEDILSLLGIKSEKKQTQPPPRYSEAGLVKELEKRGIGRPSTYASIIKTIQDRGYAVKENKSLRPTDIGEVVSAFLEKNFTKYISDTFTAEMEDELDEIAQGKREYITTLKDFYEPFHRDVEAKADIPKLTDLGPAPEEFHCPKCKSEMVIKLGRAGKFMSCSRFPDCDGMRTAEGESLEEPKDTGEACPECKEGKLVEREGKYGRFVACNQYPKCKYIKNNADNAQNNFGTGVKCPECENGEMVARRGRYGPFYSCSNYPKCKHAIKAKPTGNICQQCGALMMEGTKTIPERCSDRNCPNHNPHKKTSAKTQ
jgi:DNA topoisomerase-1